MIARSRALSASPAGMSRRRRHLVRIQGLRQPALRLGRAHLVAGVVRSGRGCGVPRPLARPSRSRKLKKLRTAESRRWMLRGASPPAWECAAKRRTCWVSRPAPVGDAGTVAVLHQRREVAARRRRPCARTGAARSSGAAGSASPTRAPLGSWAVAPRDQPAGGAPAAYRRSGPPCARGTRCSCPGGSGRGRRCPGRAGRSSPSPPAAPGRPSRSPAPSGPKRNSRCESRAWPQRGLPLANRDSKDFSAGSSAATVRTNDGRLGSAVASTSTRAAWKASKSSRRPASMRAMASLRGTAPSRRRVKRCRRSARASLARATFTSSASLFSSARELLAQHLDLALDQGDG